MKIVQNSSKSTENRAITCFPVESGGSTLRLSRVLEIGLARTEWHSCSGRRDRLLSFAVQAYAMWLCSPGEGGGVVQQIYDNNRLRSGRRARASYLRQGPIFLFVTLLFLLLCPLNYGECAAARESALIDRDWTFHLGDVSGSGIESTFRCMPIQVTEVQVRERAGGRRRPVRFVFRRRTQTHPKRKGR